MRTRYREPLTRTKMGILQTENLETLGRLWPLVTLGKGQADSQDAGGHSSFSLSNADILGRGQMVRLSWATW